MKKITVFILFLASFYFLVAKPVFAQCDPICSTLSSYVIEGCDYPGCEGCGSCEGLLQPDTGIKNRVLPIKLRNMSGTEFLSSLLKSGIVLIFVAGGVLFFFILTTGGIKWLSSSGDKAKLESAQKQISSSLVGLVILLSSFAIIKLVEVLFGIDLLNITLPTL